MFGLVLVCLSVIELPYDRAASERLVIIKEPRNEETSSPSSPLERSARMIKSGNLTLCQIRLCYAG